MRLGSVLLTEGSPNAADNDICSAVAVEAKGDPIRILASEPRHF